MSLKNKNQMAVTSDEEIESLLFTFDQIYQDFKQGISEIQILKSNYNSELNRRQSLEITCSSLHSDNERLTKIYTGSLNKLVDQLDNRSTCQSLTEELKRLNDENQTKEDEHKKAVELLKQEHAKKIGDLETQARCFLLQQAANEATINQQQRELAAHKSHIEALTKRVEWVHSDMESKHHQEIQDLKDWLLVEQEEKRELNKKLQNAENELLISRKKLEEQQRDSTSNRHVETLKQKIMKLRKENEVLKRKGFNFQLSRRNAQTEDNEIKGGE